MQQGDPLDPILFALAVNPIIQNYHTPFKVWFFDDGTLAGHRDIVAADLRQLLLGLCSIGL